MQSVVFIKMSKMTVFTLHLVQMGQQIKAWESNLAKPICLLVSGCFCSSNSRVVIVVMKIYVFQKFTYSLSCPFTEESCQTSEMGAEV